MPHDIDTTIPDSMAVTQAKICTPEEFFEVHYDFKDSSLKTGVCIGCFDILHSGHILHFLEAKRLCEILFVAITADKAIGKPGHPYFPEESRLRQVALMEPVDYCCIRPHTLRTDRFLALLKPSIYFKGSDYAESREKDLISEAEAVKLSGGEIIFTQAPCPCHSSELLDRFLNREA